jgi:CRISPR-associated protein (TIGR02584 family)
MRAESPRKVLVLVSGMSPQIITETLYALTVRQDASWCPNEIHLITTTQGRDNALLQLLAGKKHFHQFLADYQISSAIRFDEDCIHLIKDTQGKAISDLRTPEDNEAAADTITGIIRLFTQDKTTELHVSLAGGRKTMGFYAGYALSLFGRPQDKLSHVLVNEEFESNPDFFYPTPRTQVIYKNGQAHDSSKAKVWLAEIPFVRLRSGLPNNLLEGQHSFSETIKLARLATEKPVLELESSNCQFIVNGRLGHLRPAQYSLLLWAAVRSLKKQLPIPTLVDGEKRTDLAAELLEIANQHNLELHGRTIQALESDGITKAFLETNKSKLNKELEHQLGPELATLCKLEIQNHKRGGYALPKNLKILVK